MLNYFLSTLGKTGNVACQSSSCDFEMTGSQHTFGD